MKPPTTTASSAAAPSEIFVEPILPQPILYLFGAGHVSTAVAKAAQAVGFGVGVIDDREAFANAQRFPMAQEVFHELRRAFAKLQPNPSSYLVIVTRGHKEDMRVLAWRSDQSALCRHDCSRRKVLSVYKALEKRATPWKSSSAFTPRWNRHRRALT